MAQTAASLVYRGRSGARRGHYLHQLGSGIAALRARQRLTRKGLAIRLCVTSTRLGYWERGTCQPPVDVLVDLNELLGTTFEELLAAGESNESTHLRSHEGLETSERRSPMSEMMNEETGTLDMEITLPGVEGEESGISGSGPIEPPIDLDLKSERVQVDATEPDPSDPSASTAG